MKRFHNFSLNDASESTSVLETDLSSAVYLFQKVSKLCQRQRSFSLHFRFSTRLFFASNNKHIFTVFCLIRAEAKRQMCRCQACADGEALNRASASLTVRSLLHPSPPLSPSPSVRLKTQSLSSKLSADILTCLKPCFPSPLTPPRALSRRATTLKEKINQCIQHPERRALSALPALSSRSLWDDGDWVLADFAVKSVSFWNNLPPLDGC